MPFFSANKGARPVLQDIRFPPAANYALESGPQARFSPSRQNQPEHPP